MLNQQRNDFIDNFQKVGKVFIFALLFVLGGVLIATNSDAVFWGVDVLAILLPLVIALLIENALKLWIFKRFRQKIACYVLDTFLLLLLTYFTSGSLISVLYIIVLSEFYLSQENLSVNIVMGVSSIVLFLVMLAISNVLKNEVVNITQLISNALNDLILLALHFLIMNFSVQLYRKNRELAEATAELRASNEKLRIANEELKSVTLLEERQRIAKDIHDTAGHSITTVIMQTEAAKLALDEDPAGAKRKIISANLQAKHALEELRESVHLLSGMKETETLKDALENIIRESTDGTEIAVRSHIDDISFCEAKSRFLLNTLKEGISNGLRHGGATAFYFELRKEETQAEFLLSDNGNGVDMAAFHEGFGLSGMRSRLESLGGTASFESEPGEGFEIHISMPLDKEE